LVFLNYCHSISIEIEKKSSPDRHSGTGPIKVATVKEHGVSVLVHFIDRGNKGR
jgi:hypothetical protein